MHVQKLLPEVQWFSDLNESRPGTLPGRVLSFAGNAWGWRNMLEFLHGIIRSDK